MPPGPMPGPNVPTYLAQAILCTLFCCLPAGIVAIVYAAQVNSKLGLNDVHGALEASQNAKRWTWISFGVGIVIIVIVIAAGGFHVSVGSTRNP
jgi:hypothetical protein